MKSIAISSCLALAALSLYAADPQTANPVHTETLLSTPRTVGVSDSPLVHAAKSTGRLNKKPGQVITNETLVHAGGHFTTTTAEAQAQLPTHPSTAPTMDELAIQQRHAREETAAAAEAAKKFTQQKKTAAGLAAARAEGDTAEGIYADPPALENLQTAKPVSPQDMTHQQKPPL
jgi:hypothetical protein